MVHLEFNFPGQLEDLDGVPVLHTPRVCLPGMLELHVRFLSQIVFAWHFQNLA